MAKKPDAVVYNEKTKTYDAHLKPYGTDIGAPAIKLEQIGTWKQSGITRANASLAASFNELKQEFQKLQQRYEQNQLVYAASFNFKPIVGQVYFLYQKSDGTNFLSILAPEECSFKHLGSYRLNSDLMWQKVPE